jgi:hypothetical protein
MLPMQVYMKRQHDKGVFRDWIKDELQSGSRLKALRIFKVKEKMKEKHRRYPDGF